MKRKKRTRPIYGSMQWKQLRARLQRDHRHCVDCGRMGRLYVDHVIELRDGGAAFDESNLVMRCARCHQLKTQQVKRERGQRGTKRAAMTSKARPSAMAMALENLRRS